MTARGADFRVDATFRARRNFSPRRHNAKHTKDYSLTSLVNRPMMCCSRLSIETLRRKKELTERDCTTNIPSAADFAGANWLMSIQPVRRLAKLGETNSATLVQKAG